MFWGLASGRVDPRGFEIEHVLRDIQTLNEWALEGRLEVTAISLHTYPFVQGTYALLPHGASIGSGYGPIVVATEDLTVEDLPKAVQLHEDITGPSDPVVDDSLYEPPGPRQATGCRTVEVPAHA